MTGSGDPSHSIQPGLHPSNTSQSRLTHAPSSLSPRTNTSFAEQQRLPPIDTTTYGTTTAHERPISPISSLSGASSETSVRNPQGSDFDSGLHRRSSSRRRSEDEGDSRAGSDAGRDGTASKSHEGAVLGSASGWRQVVSSPNSSPTKGDGFRRRASTVELEDGSFVRRLPQIPSTQPSLPPFSPTIAAFPSSSTSIFGEEDPFRSEQASTSSTAFNPVTFDSHRRPSISRANSIPLSFAESSIAGRSLSSSSSSDGDDDGTPRARPGRSFDHHSRRLNEDAAEREARSPLHPLSSSSPSDSANPDRTPPARPRLSVKTPRLSPMFGGLSPNSAPRLSLNSSDRGRGTADDEGGWQRLSPERSRSRDRSPSRSPNLARRATLTAAAVGGLRRVSVRVVNLAGADSQRMLDSELGPSVSRSSSRSRRRRSNVSVNDEGSRNGDEEGAPPVAPERERTREDEDVKSTKEEEWEKAYEEYEASYRKLRGKTLFIFGPENRFRRACARVLTADWTEPIILVLIIFSVVVQTIQSSYNVYEHPRPTSGYFHSWEDYALFAVFIAFSVEIVARIIVTGLVINPPRPPAPLMPAMKSYEHSFKRTPSLASRVEERLSPLPSPMRSSPPLLPTQLKGKIEYPPPLPLDSTTDITTVLHPHPYNSRAGSSTALAHDTSRLLKPEPEPTGVGLGLSDPSHSNAQLSTIRVGLATSLPSLSAAGLPSQTTSKAAAPYVLAIRKQRSTYQQAFLRHSWNRIDAVAVVSFWISFVLAFGGVEEGKNLWFFRALSVLRATRLLAVTSGTQTILQSLKRASPLLVNTTLFIAFAMVLFSIIGLQSFRGSYRRYCQWIDPNGLLPDVTSDQSCGGFYNSTGQEVSYLTRNGNSAVEDPKGYLCTAPSVCIELENGWGGAQSFDNIFASLLQVTVVASANTWTDAMYRAMDADYFVSCLFFIVGLIIINYWLINLFTAVITTTFADIRDETKHSAFASSASNPKLIPYNDDRKIRRGFTRSTGFVRTAYEKTRLIWVAVVVLSVVALAARQYNIDGRVLDIFDAIEIGCTIAFDVEIAIRLFAALPDWRSFFRGAANSTDTVLAVVSSLLLIPAVRESPAYPWLTVFAIARFYRFIIAIPRMRRLLTKVLGTFAGLVNMLAFLFIMTFLMALVAVEMFRGIPDPESDDTGTIDFYQIFNSFLGMYQILSSENWTDVVNTVLSSDTGQFQIVLAAIFLSAWMFFGYFVIGNLFIAVINENFAIAEEEKKARQLETFINRTAVPGQNVTSTWLRRFDPYNYASARSKSTMEPSSDPSTMDDDPDRQMVLSPDALETEFNLKDEKTDPSPSNSTFGSRAKQRTLRFRSGLESLSGRRSETLDTLGYHQRDATIGSVPLRTREATIQEHARVQSVAQSKKDLLREYLSENPGYDKTLYLFSQDSRIRQVCQRFVEPSYGDERIKGKPASPTWKYAFNGVVLVAIIVSITIAGFATPLYRRNSFIDDGDARWNWPNLVEVGVGFVFVLEFLVKIVADGFLFSPNAYLLSLWNDIDFLVLLTLLVNIITSLAGGVGSNRFTRSLKAFRALRLINLWPTMRTTFYNVLILGFTRIIDASILAVLYIVPFAVWGMQIFSGLLYSCNDSTVTTKAQCVGEYAVAVVDDWTFLAPRVWSNPYVWSFDSFRSSLLILFEIISLEGWIDVMESVMQITGRDQQPEENASQFNALFFVLYNCVGATFILTIFLSVIIDNLHRRSATSLLTTEQRQWLDLRRLISRQRPSKRPAQRPSSSIRSWCYDRAANKHGWWNRALTGLYVLNIVVLMTESTTTAVADQARDYIYLALTILYIVDIAVRITGFGWTTYAQNYWNVYDVIVVGGTFATTIALLFGTSNQVALQLQKLFLVSIVFKLVQRSDSLNQLQKTAAASLPAILNIFALWLVLFLVFAIFYIEVFGLTRWEHQETHNANYYTFWNAMVLLVLQSTGEGWNEFMHDFTVEFPRCTESLNYLESDCGSSGWAYALFSIWNILSMYLFTNLVLGAVIENFSFVFQDYGKVTNINRAQMRSFKKVWSDFDPERSGYLQKEQIPRFLSRLTGIFDVKIYREGWSVHSILALSRRDPASQHQSPAFYHYLQDRDALSLRKLDLSRLRAVVESIDPDEIDQRKADYNLLYHESMLEAEATGKGISFGGMLRVLAHYRLIDDDNALQIDELIRRRAKLQHVYQRVRQDRLDSFFAMIIARRRFLLARQAQRRDEMGGVPAIQVDEGDRSG